MRPTASPTRGASLRAAERYAERVALLVRVLPLLGDERDFALKGGTAINLFHRGMPRLSVDLDLTFLPVADREMSLDAIEIRLRRIATAIEQGIPGSHARPVLDPRTQVVTKVIVQRGRAQVKLEVTPVLRGCVYAPETRDVHRSVEDKFGYARAQLVSFSDLYAGKLVAACDVPDRVRGDDERHDHRHDRGPHRDANRARPRTRRWHAADPPRVPGQLQAGRAGLGPNRCPTDP